jgi:hypothetical protein
MSVPLRTDFDQFLFAPVADDANGMRLTMVTVLARTGVDPWDEAAGLAQLSRESAIQKLVSLLAGVPNGPSPGADTTTLAARLVALLHGSRKPATAAAVEKMVDSTGAPRKPMRLAAFALLTLMCLFVIYRAMSGA